MICDKFRTERLRLLEEKLQNALLQIDDLTRKNKALEEQLRLATAGREIGRRNTVPGDRKGGQSLVLGDTITRNVGCEFIYWYGANLHSGGKQPDKRRCFAGRLPCPARKWVHLLR